MRDSALKLQDKTVVLTGPFGGVTQGILRTLTEFGCDVAYISNQAHYASKFCESMNDLREVHPEYGRAVHLNMALETEAQIKEALAKVVETVGRMDVLIDGSALMWTAATDLQSAQAMMQVLIEQSVPFFAFKKRGRIVVMTEDKGLAKFLPAKMQHPGHSHLVESVVNWAKAYGASGVTVNALSLGITDDVLLKIFPGSTSLKKSFTELQAQDASLKLIDFNDIGITIAYMISGGSACLTGQVLRLTGGLNLS